MAEGTDDRPPARPARCPVAGPRRTPVGINVGTGAALVAAGTLVASGLPGELAGLRFATVALGVGVAGAVTVDHVALAGVVVLGWLAGNGFLENRAGALSWHAFSDPYLIALLLAFAAGGLLAGHAYRRLGHRSVAGRGGPGRSAIPVQHRATGPDDG